MDWHLYWQWYIACVLALLLAQVQAHVLALLLALVLALVLELVHSTCVACTMRMDWQLERIFQLFATIFQGLATCGHIFRGLAKRGIYFNVYNAGFLLLLEGIIISA